jgi:ATP-dependent Clp protease, protease subunit
LPDIAESQSAISGGVTRIKKTAERRWRRRAAKKEIAKMSFRFDSLPPAQTPKPRLANPKTARPQFKASLAADGAIEMLIYGDIVDAATISMLEAWGYPTDGLISALNVKKALDAGGTYSKVRLRINSPGGDAFEGMAIHSLLQACGKPVEAYIDGIAASSASIVAMAADTRVMGRTAMMMIHNAWASCIGNKAEMTKMADTLNAIDESIASAYVDRMNVSLQGIQSLMDAESWFSAEACVENGLATATVAPAVADEVEALAQARRFRMSARFQHVPDRFRASEQCDCDCENCQGGDCGACTNAECDDPNCADCPMQNSTAAGNDIASLRSRLDTRSRFAASAGVDEDEISRLRREGLHGRSGASDRANGDEVSVLSSKLRNRAYFSADAIANDAEWRRNNG